LLDEPFSALDVQLRLQLRGELRRLQDEIGATTVLVTHDPAEAMALADELLLLVDGAVLQAGPAAALYARPVNELAARLLGAEIIGAGRAVGPYAVDVGGGVHLAVAGAPLVPGRSVGWAVAADQIRLTPEGPYPIEVASLGPVQSGRRNAGIRLGALELSVLIDPSMDQIGPFAALIDPLALQVWSQPED
jgi:ABC-type Fe3+/spermidine/putrescine transport system ATPase subunit